MVLNEDGEKDEMYEQVWSKALDIVGRFRDQIELDED